MEHAIETASSGRARCRGCGEPIARGELRLGERLPNPFSERTPMTLWFHLRCGAYKRPGVLLEVLESTTQTIPDHQPLLQAARFGLEHRRLPRVDGAQRAPSGRARCRSCREPITKGDWRIALVYYEEGCFEPSGYIHVVCSAAYFGTADLLDRALHFAPDLDAAARDELEEALGEAS